MNDPFFSPAEKAALDHFAAPPLSAGFAERVNAAAAEHVGPEPASRSWLRRGGRSGWRRPAGIVSGGLALGLLSAAAAATGYLGEQARVVIRDTPVIGPIIAQVAPVPKPVRVPAKRIEKPSVAANAVEKAAPQTLEALRREAFDQRIAERLERRAERRKALGLPPAPLRQQIRQALREMPPEQRREIVQRIREMPPEERKALRERVREIRRERMIERRRYFDERRAQAADPQPDENIVP